MQLLSQGLIAAILPGPHSSERIVEFLQRPEFARALYLSLGLLIVSQGVVIFAHWVAAKAVAGPHTALFRNAVKLWAFHLLFIFGAAIAFSLLIPAVIGLENRFQTIAILGGAALLTLVAFFFIPMRVYVLGFLRALGLLLLSWLIATVIMFAIEFVVVRTLLPKTQMTALQEFAALRPEEQRHFFERLAGQDAPDEIDRLLDDSLQPIGPRKSLPEREAAVLAIQRLLEARRRTLPPGNAAAAAAFQRQLDRYLRLLEVVKTERRASPANAIH